MIKSVTVRRFKRLQDVTIPLCDSTVLVGPNNAGKSSVLQAIHFAVAVAQTTKLIGGVSWASDKYQLSFSPAQLLYTPVADVLTLASGGELAEDITRRIEISLADENGSTCLVALRRGRNRNIQVLLEGRALGEQLQDLSSPFSVYAPGLAGVPREEHYISPGVVRRAIARGDANVVLRNVLYQLSKDEQGWGQFHDDIRELFPNAEISVDFNQDTDEYIRAAVSIDGGTALPLDAAGTAVLQASQVLSYVTLFKPKILILDEPDSHLHPNNQRALCSLIFRLSQSRGFQAVMSTHSRHVLDAMRGRGNLVWLSQGGVVQGAEQEATKMLLDIGALDSLDYFADGGARCVVATEDEKRELVQQLLWSSGFREDETAVLAYSGASKADAAVVLGQFLKEKAPGIRMIVHRDSDYGSPEEVAAFEARLKKNGLTAFVTQPSDIEGYFLNTQHVVACHPKLDANRVNDLLAEAVTLSAERSIKSIVDQRTKAAFRERTETGKNVDHGEIAIRAHRDYAADPAKMARGKVVLGTFVALLQKELGANPNLVRASAALAVPALVDLAKDIWAQEEAA